MRIFSTVCYRFCIAMIVFFCAVHNWGLAAIFTVMGLLLIVSIVVEERGP